MRVHDAKGLSAAVPFLNQSFATLMQSLYTYFGDQEDLVEVLRHLEKPEVLLPAWADGMAPEDWQSEAARLTHNWLAAAGSLVSHARRVTRGTSMVSEAVLGEYLTRTQAEFTCDPLHQFVQKLRNFALHYDVPLTQMAMGGSLDNGVPGPDWRQGVSLDLKTLREWDGWNKGAKAFLASHGDNVFLVDLVDQYGAKVQSFYSWLLQRDREDQLARCPFVLRSDPGGET